MRLLFIGPPGAGKGTQSVRVAERLGIAHVSTGEMFRHHVDGETDLGRRVRIFLEAGEFVPDEVTVAMLKERLRAPDARGGYILDGFPRTLGQVEALDDLIGEDGLDGVVLFVVDHDVLVSRMLERGRSDDTEETVGGRLRLYEEETAPLVKLYRDRGLVVEVDGTGEVDQITERVLGAVRG